MSDETKRAVEEWREWFQRATGGYWDTVKCMQCALGRDCAEHPTGDGNDEEREPGGIGEGEIG
jgi:hypothetical protein